MGIKKRDLLHGAVLTQIIRNDQPVALTLIESDNSRAAYRLNDEVTVYIKYATSSASRAQQKNVWTFTFTQRQIADLEKLKQETDTYLALVCGSTEIGDDMEVCFLIPDDIWRCLDIPSNQKNQTITVELEEHQRFRVYGKPRTRDANKLKIPKNRLIKWVVPGR